MYASNALTLVLLHNRLFWKISFKFVSALSDRLFLFAMSASVFSLDPSILAFFHSFSFLYFTVYSSVFDMFIIRPLFCSLDGSCFFICSIILIAY